MVGYSPMFAALNLDNRSRLAMGEIVTGNYFQVFGVGAALGRTILPADDAPGAPRVAMVSHRYWTRELGVGARTPSAARSAFAATPTRSSASRRPAFSGMVPILAPEMWIPVVRVARRRAGRHARHGAVADRHDAARSARRSLAVHARPAEAGQDDRAGARQPDAC